MALPCVGMRMFIAIYIAMNTKGAGGCGPRFT